MKVLIITSKCGMGHYKSALAIGEDLEKCNFISEVKYLDLYDFLMKKLAPIFYRAYSLVVNKGNHLYNYLYNKKLKSTHPQSKFEELHSKGLGRFKNLIERENPDLIISTFSQASSLVASYKEKYKSSIPLLTWITDVKPHYGWINEYTNYYFVAGEDGKNDLIKSGVPANKIYTAGIPVDLKFKNFSSNIKKDKILVSGGGLGILPKDPNFYRELEKIESAPVYVICGKNEHLLKYLRTHFPKLKSLGFVDNMPDLMRQAQLLIAKPGGVTSFEAIYSETPLLLLPVKLGQEIFNANFLKSRGLAMSLAKDPFSGKTDYSLISSLASDQRSLEFMRTSACNLKSSIDSSVLIELLKSEKRRVS
ncbi:hypothetical protein LV469_07840 [Peptoniphilus sp. GNH]|nr:hypothetical protein LV469_07840 [Peptoniphilus sp. GNH]